MYMTLNLVLEREEREHGELMVGEYRDEVGEEGFGNAEEA